MKLLEFASKYPDEASCIAQLREIREKVPHVCPKCGHQHWYWNNDKVCYECKNCHYRESLRKGTVMENSKLPFRYWSITMHLPTTIKNIFSAMELQLQLEHKRYQPIWEILHRLRDVMGKRDGKYILNGNVEIDEAFFSAEVLKDDKDEDLKRSYGSQSKTKVLVMAENESVDYPNNPDKPKNVGHIKMVVMSDLKTKAITPIVEKSINSEVLVVRDGT